MSSSPKKLTSPLAATLDPELKAKWEALLDPKIKPSEDGTCVVSIAAMQYIHDELRKLTDKLDDLKDPAKKMLFQQVHSADKKPDVLDVAKIAVDVPSISSKLRDLHLTLQMSLPMVGFEDYNHLNSRIPPYRVILSESSLWDLPRATPNLLDPLRPCCNALEADRAMVYASAPPVVLDAVALTPAAAAPAYAPAPAETYDEEDLYA